jgi:hypothetical protein
LRKFTYLLVFPLLLIHADFKLKFFLPRKGIKVLCLYDEDTSLIPKEKLEDFMSLLGTSFVKWLDNLDKPIRGFKYLILAKGNLSQEERRFILEYLEKGGGLILFLPKEIDESFLKEIGIRTYQIPEGLKACLDGTFFNGIYLDDFKFYKGVVVKTGYGGQIREPTRGNVFPERIPVRDFTVIVRGEDGEGRFLASGVLLVKHWYNPWQIKSKVPPRWLIFSTLNYDLPPRFYSRLARLVREELLLERVEAELPVYFEGESVKVKVKLHNLGKDRERVRVYLYIYRDGELIYKSWRQKLFGHGMHQIWFTPLFKFRPGFYKLKALLYRGGILVDYTTNAFLYAPDKIRREFLSLDVKKGKFLVSGKEVYLLGINYYESKLGELNWIWPNLDRINEDFKLMKKMGFKVVRIHYHHPKWFRDYLEKVNSPFKKFFPQKDPLPSEEDLRILDAFIYLAQLNNLIICLDLFSLVPNEMGDPLGWLGMKERIRDVRKVDLQLKFVKLIAQRYKDIPGITWDLWNEPRLEEADRSNLKRWTERIIREFRINGDRHLITIGGNDSLYMEEILDYLCVHTDKIEEAPLASKPVLIQEFWLAKDLDGEGSLKEELKKVLDELKEANYRGFMPWQFTRQSRLWDKFEAEKWDDDLGLILREDGSLRLLPPPFGN